MTKTWNLRLGSRIVLSLILQGLVFLLAIVASKMPALTEAEIGNWLLAPSIYLADVPIPVPGVFYVVFVVFLLAGFVWLGKPSGQGAKMWLRLFASNAGGVGLLCLISWQVAARFPIPPPLLTPYESVPSEKAEYLKWYKQGYRDGMLACREIICILGWSDMASLGYGTGYDVGRQTFNKLSGSKNCKLTPAITALLQGDTERAFSYLNKSNIDERDYYGRTVLMTACSSHLNIPTAVDRLVSMGADINAQDHRGNSPLVRAVSRGNTNVILRLLDSGASYKTTNSSGITALHAAAQNGWAPTIQLLINRGSEIEATNSRGLTPLMEAVGNGCIDAVKTLLANGANVNAKNKRGEPVISMIPTYIKEANVPIMKELLKYNVDLSVLDKLNNRDKKDALEILKKCEEQPVRSTQ